MRGAVMRKQLERIRAPLELSMTNAISPGSGLWLAPAVVALRMPLLLAELALPAERRTETNGALTEKIIAAQVGAWSGIMSFWVRAAWMPCDLVQGHSPQSTLVAAQTKGLAAALGPSEQQVRRNYRRLMGRRQI